VSAARPTGDESRVAKPTPAKPARKRKPTPVARIVPLTEELLSWAMAEEPDPLTAWLADRLPGWARQFTAPTSIGMALIGEGRVLAAGGLIPQWPGRAYAWLMLSPRAKWRHKTQALRQLRRTMAEMEQRPEWRRIEMFVRADAPWCDRFAEFVGMQFEGLARAWDPLGRDYKLFARVGPEPIEWGTA
jgi:hypothetical protein